MDVDGGKSKYGQVGAKYGLGHCGAQCFRVFKFINGETNMEACSQAKPTQTVELASLEFVARRFIFGRSTSTVLSGSVGAQASICCREVLTWCWYIFFACVAANRFLPDTPTCIVAMFLALAH